MPDDYLTVDEVAAQLAVPLEMIQRRIESGDIPVHWVEIGGKLEMRISATEIGVSGSGGESTPFPTSEGFGAREDESEPTGGEGVARGWAVRDSQYPGGMWATPEGEPAAAAAESDAPWEAGAEEETATSTGPFKAPWESSGDIAPPTPEVTTPVEPVWRQDPGTWEDEPLEVGAAPAPTPSLSEYNPAGTDSYFPLETEAAGEYPIPPPPTTPSPFAGRVDAVDQVEDDEEASPFGSDEEEEEDISAVETVDFDTPMPSNVVEVPELVDVPRPSALAAAQGPESALAINSIDARELVAGLFERWERALEQRIQAEQRLRFEAELERRLRQVRDLRQELDNTRKSTAAQLAEREQEVMALRNRLREEEPPPTQKGRGLFRR
jgi:excisionase family DNA binding protein